MEVAEKMPYDYLEDVLSGDQILIIRFPLNTEDEQSVREILEDGGYCFERTLEAKGPEAIQEKIKDKEVRRCKMK